MSELVVAAGLLFSILGCSKPDEPQVSEPDSLKKIALQLDWYAEPAHGGFYEALLKGFYKDEGLDVSIAQGGPGAEPLQSVSIGQADFALSRVDDVVMGIDRGLPLMLVMAYMQRDPQAIMFHASQPIRTLQDLDGKTIMVKPSSTFVTLLEKRHGIQFDILPIDYGIQRFLADPNFIQQCFVTSQPYFAEQEGVHVGTMLLSESGYSPERVVMTNRSLAKREPEVVAAFARASIKGWQSYMDNDPSETHERLIDLNAGNNRELNEYSRNAMKVYHIVSGEKTKGESMGLIAPAKLVETIAMLHEFGMLEKTLTLDRVIDYSILPRAVGEAGNN